MNFVALDFETANYNSTSVCSVGIAIIEEGELRQSISRLVKPYPNYYINRFTDIHGIDSKMTDNEPDFETVWNDIKPLLENKIVVAHNAAFDFNVLGNSLTHYNIEYPNLHYYCSVAICRKTFSYLESHQLSTMCNYLSIELNHHNAESDAVGAAKIVLSACKKNNVKSFTELAEVLGIRAKRL